VGGEARVTAPAVDEVVHVRMRGSTTHLWVNPRRLLVGASANCCDLPASATTTVITIFTYPVEIILTIIIINRFV